MAQAYLKSHYCYHTCSRCGVGYSDEEYYKYYSLKNILRFHINCKKCGAIFTEQPKRCFWEEHYPDRQNACTESIVIDGISYCTKQTKCRREELRKWGCYYSCEAMQPPKVEELPKEENTIQLSFFETLTNETD